MMDPGLRPAGMTARGRHPLAVLFKLGHGAANAGGWVECGARQDPGQAGFALGKNLALVGPRVGLQGNHQHN
jgi:hypothetical protein